MWLPHSDYSRQQKPEKFDFLKLVGTLNRAISDTPVPEHDLEDVFNAMWPTLAERLKAADALSPEIVTRRGVDEMVVELLELARSAERRRAETQGYKTVMDQLLPALKHLGLKAMARGIADEAGQNIVSGSAEESDRRLTSTARCRAISRPNDLRSNGYAERIDEVVLLLDIPGLSNTKLELDIST